MRLLCGIVTLDGSDLLPHRLQAMADGLRRSTAKAHCTLWHSGPAGLAVVDFDGTRPADDPLLRQPSGSLLAADVRLDEPVDLGQSLGITGSSDADLTAAALDRWGREAPAKLLGDFALASWNAQTRELLLARDIAGVRPLVYHLAPRRHFLFASFPAGIHASGLLPRELNEAALIHSMYLSFSKVETWSRGVQALPPATTLQLRDGRIDVTTYWKPTRQPRRHKNPAEAAEDLRTLLTRAVGSRLPGSGPVAAHLSGGLDSTAVAVLASRALRQQGRHLLAYSFLLTPEERLLEEDEMPYVQAALAQEPQIGWTPVYPMTPDRRLRSPLDVDAGFVLDDTDPENVVCQAASAAGASVILSGWGGDEAATFNGRGMLAHALRHGHWLYFAKEVQALRRQRGFALRNILLGEVAIPLVPESLERWLAQRRGRSAGLLNKPDLIAPGPFNREQQVRDGLRVGSDLRKTQRALLSSGHLATRTAEWAGIGARYGLAFAFPLLDRRIQEFALALPPTAHVRDGWRRRPFRDAMEGILPARVQWRHDKLAPLPQTQAGMLGQKRAMLERTEELSKHGRVSTLFNMGAVRALLESLPENDGNPSAANTDVSFVFACVSVALRYAGYVAEHF